MEGYRTYAQRDYRGPILPRRFSCSLLNGHTNSLHDELASGLTLDRLQQWKAFKLFSCSTSYWFFPLPHFHYCVLARTESQTDPITNGARLALPAQRKQESEIECGRLPCTGLSLAPSRTFQPPGSFKQHDWLPGRV